MLAHSPTPQEKTELEEMRSALLETLISLFDKDTGRFQSYGGAPLSGVDDGKLANTLLAGLALLPYAKDCKAPAAAGPNH